MSNYKSESMYECDCGQQFYNEIELDQHKTNKCQNRSFSCAFCNESIQTWKMNEHLYYCGNKTNKCPNCSKYIRRAIYNYHLDNNCIDFIEDNTNDQYQLISRIDQNSTDDIFVPCEICTKQIKFSLYDIHMQNCDKQNITRSKLNSNENLLTNSINNDKNTFRQNPVRQIEEKSTSIRCELTKDYYSTEIDHAIEKLLFNIILMGSPRVGKSQLINALCKQENLAKTSPSLNSCTKEISCYTLEDDQEQTPGIEPFRIHFYDTPGIESWTNENGQTTMLNFIEEKNPVCVIYCASPGSFADLKQLHPVLEFCKNKQIFCALVCTNMWLNPNRKLVIQEFEKELAFFGQRIEKLFDQGFSRTPHKVTIFGNGALCTMVNSVEYYDEEFSDQRMPVQGIDELIHCIMEQLDQEKLIGWCNAVLYRRSYWEKISQKVNGFCLTYLPNLSNISNTNREQIFNHFALKLFNLFRK